MAVSVGFLILRNKYKSESYTDEQEFLKTIADYTASMLRNFRRDKSSEKLHTFRIHFIRNYNDLQSNEQLYNGCVNAVAAIYGKTEFVVVELSPESQASKISYSYPENSAFISIDDIREDLSSWIQERNHEPVSFPEKGLFVIPTTAESGRITNFIIIKANRKPGRNFTRYISELVSLITFKQSLIRKKQRMTTLTEFGRVITEKVNLTQEDVFNLVYEYTSKVMSVANMYIALLDKNGEITFPLFRQKDEETEEIKDIKVDVRIFDKNSNQKGRTEVILEKKEHILIHTRKQSEDWYAEPGHQNKIDDPFAAWAGVPILNKDEAIGVIAIYHPTAEYLYTDENIFFLKNISTHISDLLTRLVLEDMILNNTELQEANRRLEDANRKLEEAQADNTELQEVNRKLEEAQADVLEKENLLASSLVAQDITHRLNNTLGSLSINLNQARENIQRVINTRDTSCLQETYDTILADSAEVVDNLIGEVKSVANPKPQDIFVKEITDKLVSQVMIKNKLNEKVAFSKDYPSTNIKVKAPYRNLATCLHELIENAALALFQQLQEPVINDRLFLKVVIQEKDSMVLIDITDNGVSIPDDVKTRIFERGVTSKSTMDSGYGLWRAKALAHSLEGELELLETKPEIKTFRLSLPIAILYHTYVIIKNLILNKATQQE